MTQNSTKKNIVILGGSYGGISTAHYLLKHVVPKLPDSLSYQVVLASTSDQAMCRLACPRALISDDLLPQGKLFVSIVRAFEQYPKDNFLFVDATATKLDHKKRTVTIQLPGGSTEDIEFHALVIATGASNTSPLLGLNRDVDFLRSSWSMFRKALPSAKSIVVVGGGPAGVETAGELGEYLNGRAGWFHSGMSNPKVQITVVTAGPQILPALRPTIAKQAEGYLAKVGVTVVINVRMIAVNPPDAGTYKNVAGKATVTLENGKTMETDLYIPATGMTPNTSFVDKSLLGDDGRVETNPSTIRVERAGPRIYAIGDAASFTRPAIHLILNAVPILCTNMEDDLLLAAGKESSLLARTEHTLRTSVKPRWCRSVRARVLVLQWDIKCPAS
ncbi:hypothetical protein LTS15_005978 [Exophiala xenobiotica]|nr:hypothetical protein LTS15_005978 [Exophiala xenobiotica]